MGGAVETPGGWQDFLSQNPGFFGGRVAREPTRNEPAKAPPKPSAPKPQAKLSYKDQRRLEELEKMVADAPAKMAALEAKLADSALYTRDPAGFDKINRDLEAHRKALAAGEDEWLELEAKRESLAR